MTAKRIALDSLLTALALVIFVVELLVPLPLPIPGVKLGLSNIVTLFAFFACGPLDAFVILLLRIGLGTIFSGNLSAILYSLAGGLLCYLSTLFLKRFCGEKQIFVCGIFGAISHNIGQLSVSAIVLGTPSVLYYLPVLILAAIVTGTLTGLTAQTVFIRTKKIFDFSDKTNRRK